MFRSSALAVAVLLLAVGAVQAQTLPPEPDPEGLTDDLPDVGDIPPAPPEEPDVRDMLLQTKREARAAVEQARAVADPDALYATAMDTVRPAQSALDDAQRQVGALIDDEEEEGEPEPELAPQAEASIASAWPDLAPPVLLLAGTAAGLGLILWLLGQSATVGAGAAGMAARDGRRFLPLASPLFTRFEKDTVLGHPKREAIYGHIISTPGITLQDLCKESGLSRTAVTHHLRLLEQQHLVVSKRVGRSRHFFENGGRYGRHQKDAYAVLHNDRSKEIHAFIRDHPGAIQKDLCQAFGIQASVAHWHVKRLVDADLVEAVRRGRTVSYFPAARVAAPVPAPAPLASPA